MRQQPELARKIEGDQAGWFAADTCFWVNPEQLSSG